MKLLGLNIANFRGTNALSIIANGNDVNIFGRNGTGKTTTEDAFLWLLFGKDSADKKDYDLIPHKQGTAEPDTGVGKEPTVEANIEYFGKTIKLKKAYLEEWPKKGEMKGQYAGSKTHYYVDDLEVKAGEYQAITAELVDDKLFKLITNPQHFTEVLSWQERRETLVKIAGDLEVAPSAELAELMGEREFSKFHALAKQNVKAKQKELDGLPYAVTEARRMVPEELPAMEDIGALTADKAELEEQLLSLKNDDTANAKRKQIAEVETELAEARSKYTAAVNADNERFLAGIKKLNGEWENKSRELSKLTGDIRNTQDAVESLSAKKAAALKDWHEANDRKWTGSEMCPTCGQAMPAEQVEAAKATFNRQRSADLERLIANGTALKNEIEGKKADIDEMQTAAATLESEISTLEARIEKGASMIKPCNFDDSEFKARLESLRAELANGADEGKQAKAETLNGQIADIQNRIDNANRAKIQIEQAAEQKKHVDELMARDAEINAELGKWERAVNLCEQHVKASAKALEQAVNGKFKIARFRLFQTQKNGEEAECCDVVYPNGSTNLSTGERLQTGVDIINTLTEFYGVDAPIWIDNAEGVTLPVETGSQVVRLIVSPSDEKLRVEVI